MKPLLLFTFILLLTAARLQAQNVVKVPTPGSLASQLTQAQRDTCTQLTVQGKLNSADIRVLRQMGGYKEDGCTTGKLQTLNLADAEFVTDKKPYMVLDAKKEKVAATSLIAKIRSGSVNIGRSALQLHIRSKVSSGTDLGTFIYQNVLYYHPFYFIGRDESKEIQIQTKTPYLTERNYGSPRFEMQNCDGQFFFASSSFTDKEWRMMKKRKITTFKGHRVVQKGDNYLLYIHSHKDFLPDDMFHGCNRLQTIIIPKRMKVDCSLVIDETSSIKYQLPWDEITLYYRSRQQCYELRRPASLFGFDGCKKKIIYDATSTNLYKVLKELQPVKPSSKYVPNIRACFIINYADGRKSVRYDIDSDMKHVVTQEGNLYYKVSDDLLSEMKKLHVSTLPCVKPLLEKSTQQNGIIEIDCGQIY